MYEICDSCFMRGGKENDNYKLFISFLISKYIYCGVLVWNRKYGFSDCFEPNYSVGYEITPAGIEKDSINTSFACNLTNNKNILEDELNNFKTKIVDKIEKLQDGNYSLIKGKIYLCLSYLHMVERSDINKTIFELSNYFNSKASVRFDGLCFFATSSILFI